MAIGIDAKRIGQTLLREIILPYHDYPPMAADIFFCRV